MSKKGLSRRQFITGAAVTVAATTVPVLSNVATAEAAGAAMPALVRGDAAWVALDPKALARQAYEIYKGVHTSQSACCEATFWPIVGALGALYPTTWGLFPKGVFNYGGGGINSWRSICGCTNAGSAVLKLALNNGPAIDEYLAWYEKTALPTSATYDDYLSGTWTPGGSATGWGTGAKPLPIPASESPASKAGSVLCHASLTNWRIAGGAWEQTHAGSQSDRCGKLCYDCVYKLATIVNAYMAGTNFVGALDASVATCGEGTGSACHGTTSGVYGNPLAQGKMKCTSCHE